MDFNALKTWEQMNALQAAFNEATDARSKQLDEEHLARQAEETKQAKEGVRPSSFS